MKKIQNFYVDRNKSIIEINKDLMFFIENFSNKQELSELLNWISVKTKISVKSLKLDTQKFVFDRFVNIKGKFNNSFLKKKIFYDSIKFITIFYYIRLFSKKIKKQYNCELIVDDISNNTSPDRFEKLNKLCKTIFVSTIKLDKKYNTFLFRKYMNCALDKNITNNLIFYLFLFFKTFYCSFKIGSNLFPLISRLILFYLKYETVFRSINSKFLIQERHYNTSAIKNEIFHKHGGKICSSIQKNILQINGIGMYIYSDILFSLGEKTASMVEKLGGEVKKILPVGSLFMERNLFDRKFDNDFFSYDMLVFASDHTSNFHSGYNSYYSDYYLHFEWIKKFSKEHPNFKIGIKLKKILKDRKVKEIFSNTKNVKFLVDKSSDWSDTYFLGKKAKSLCTWSSTLGFEFIGYGKECYFLDPGRRNISFLPNEEYLTLAKVKEYNEFRDKVLKLIKGEKNHEIIKNKKNFCFNSNDVSEKILKNFRNFENNF